MSLIKRMKSSQKTAKKQPKSSKKEAENPASFFCAVGAWQKGGRSLFCILKEKKPQKGAEKEGRWKAMLERWEGVKPSA